MNMRNVGWAVLLLALCLPPAVRPDDDDEDDEREESGHGRGHSEERGRSAGGDGALRPASDPVYTDTCATCHFAYPPELLPARSWARLMSGLDKHFGESVELSPKDRTTIASYLQANAADHSRAKRAVSILRSIGGGTPERITETPYIRGKHDELAPAVLKRKSIGSLSNCTACHQSASKGIFEEDDVKIPAR